MADSAPLLRIDGVSKSFGAHQAVANVSLDIRRGEFFSLLGPSGCGKSTLLRLLAGLETPDAGRIFINGEEMTRTPPHARPVNMMFQNYALFPHMTVEKNVAFGLEQERRPKQEIKTRVAEMLELVRMTDYARRKPDQLSGGQRQRVALARALAKHPKLLLLDEPLAALDKKLREHTRFELMNIQARVGITFIMVTHDQDEAMALSSRVAVMRAGRIAQVGAPAEIYEHPATRAVAEFVGDVNIFEGTVSAPEESLLRVRCADAGEIAVAYDSATVYTTGAEITVAVRPEKIRVDDTPPPGANVLRGTVLEAGYLGDVSVYHIKTASGRVLRAQVTNAGRYATPKLPAGSAVTLWWWPSSGVVLHA